MVAAFSIYLLPALRSTRKRQRENPLQTGATILLICLAAFLVIWSFYP